MRRTVLGFLLAAAAACGDNRDPMDVGAVDAAVEPDAPAIDGDFSCVGVPRSETAPDPLDVLGTTVGVAGGGVGGLSIELRSSADDALLGTATSRGGIQQPGNYGVELATGGVAPTLYRKISGDGFLDVYDYDPAPVGATYRLATQVQRPEDLDLIYQQAGLTPDPTKGVVWIEIQDCIAPDLGGHDIEGATVEVTRGTVVYIDETGQLVPERTSAGRGGAAILNVDPGELDPVIRAGSVVYRSWPVVVHPGAFTFTHRMP